MSAHRGGLEPATRVRSTKDGPAERSASRPAGAVAAAWLTSAPASTCGRCDTSAIRRSWTSASIATGRAPTEATRPCRRWNRSVRASGPGVRNQVAPRKSSCAGEGHARALPAADRVPADEAGVVGGRQRRHHPRLGRPEVGDHAPGSRVVQRAARQLRDAGHGRAEHHGVGLGRRLLHPAGDLGDRADRQGHPQRLAVGVDPDHPGVRAGAQGQPQRAAHEPDADAATGLTVWSRRGDGHRSGAREHLAHEVDAAPHVRDPLAEGVGVERLRAVAEGVLRGRVDLDDERRRRPRPPPPGPSAGSGRACRPRGCGSTITGRWLCSLTTGTAEMSSVLRVAVLEGADAALAEHRPRVALARMYSADRAILDRARHAALEQHRRARLADLASRSKFCMLRAPIWIMSAYARPRSTCRGSMTSVTTGRPVSSPAPRPGSRGRPRPGPGRRRARCAACRRRRGARCAGRLARARRRRGSARGSRPRRARRSAPK